MLIFGKPVGDWKEKAAYAQHKADNEFAELREVRCEGIDNVDEAFAAMAAFASDGKCKKFLYHATINLYSAERLTPDQWRHAVDTLERNLKLDGHYRVVFEHIKKNRQHYHIVWSRFPPEGGPAVEMNFDYSAHQKTKRALEAEFGIKVAPAREKSKASHKKQEIRDRNNAIKLDEGVVRKEVISIYHRSNTSKEFVKGLSASGYALCRGRGDKRVLVDQKGGYHGLLRRLDGIRVQDMRNKFPALEKMDLPALNKVLSARRAKPATTFRPVSSSMFSRTGAGKGMHLSSGYRPIFHMPTGPSIETLIARARRLHKPERKPKYQPRPYKRKRRKKEGENQPSRPIINLKEIENAELLAWAWENHRLDVLSQFGIYLPIDFFEP